MIRFRPRIGALFLAALPLVGLVACSAASSSSAPGETESNATVDSATARRAFAIVRGIRYLPFAYRDDGCYARALYMSMELAVAKIPSSAHFIAGDLRPPQEMWRFHVAPMLKVIGQDHLTILDPSLAGAPLPVADWIARTHPQGAYNTFYVPGSRYISLTDLAASRSEQSVMITSFDQLPPFKKSDVQDACQFLWNALDWETPSHDELRPALLGRTKQLLAALAGLGKLTDDMQDAGAFDCEVPRDQ